MFISSFVGCFGVKLGRASLKKERADQFRLPVQVKELMQKQ
jgi:hypothetical protein